MKMNSFIVCIGIIFSVVCLCNCETENNLLILTSENFTSTVQQYQPIMVEFYAPWCAHCKKLAPEYAKAAAMLKAENSPIVLAMVDATVEKALAQQHEVRAYPTLKFFYNNGVTEVYRGKERSAKAIVAWMKRKTHSGTAQLDSVQAIRDFTNSFDFTVIGFFDDAANSHDVEVFKEVARDMEQAVFGITSSTEAIAEYLPKGAQRGIVLFKKSVFDEPIHFPESCEMPYKVKELQDFIESYNQVAVPEFSESLLMSMVKEDPKLTLLLFLPKSSPHFPEWQAALQRVARRLLGKMRFAYVDTDTPEGGSSSMSKLLEVPKTNEPVLRILNLKENIKFRPEDYDETESRISLFANAVLSGSGRPFLRSQPLPPDWDAEPVKILVGSNFDAVARNPSMAVFVQFYSPSCVEDCEVIAPLMEQLAEEYNGKILFAKMKTFINEVRHLRVSGDLHFKYFPRGSDQVIDYLGHRTRDAFKAFLDSDGQNNPSQEEPPMNKFNKVQAEDSDKEEL